MRNGIVIEREDGKPTGNALVFMNNQADVMSAKKELHLKYIGKRYIEVLTFTENY